MSKLALTLWQPWCSAIVEGDKRLENRTWAPPDRVIGKRIWLHAGKRWDEDGALTCALKGFDREKQDVPLGAIIGSARVDGFQSESMGLAKCLNREGWLQESGDRRADKWWIGPVAWVLSDVQALRSPVPAVGHQQLWVVPGDVLEQLAGASR